MSPWVDVDCGHNGYDRDTGLMTLVDRKEFLLIQLRAEEY